MRNRRGEIDIERLSPLAFFQKPDDGVSMTLAGAAALVRNMIKIGRASCRERV
jgi:hypothetical protein